MTTSTTCQICGRIAHRGYRRPGQGWQTASCSGALGLPYEVSCDLLPPTIAAVETFIASTERRLRDLLAEPPAPFVLQRRDAWGKPIGQPFDAARPDGFALDRPVPAVGRAARTYGQEFRRRRRELEASVAGAAAAGVIGRNKALIVIVIGIACFALGAWLAS